MTDKNNLYSNLTNFYNLNDKNFKEFLADLYQEMLTNHRDVQYIREHLTEEIDKKILKEFENLPAINNMVREKVEYFINNNNNIKDITEKLTTNTNKIENVNSQLDTKIRYVNTVTELKREDLKVNETVKTLGYYNIGDGGASYYIITDEKIQENDIDIISCKNNLIAKLIVDTNYVEGKQFGAKTGSLPSKRERIENKNRLQRCIDFAIENNIKLVKFEQEYRVETEYVDEYALTISYNELLPKNCLDIEMNCYLQCYNCSGFLIKNLSNSNLNINLAYGGYSDNPELVTGVTILNSRQLNFNVNGNNYNGTLIRVGNSQNPVNFTST